MAERQAHVPRGPFHLTPVFVKSAKGAMIEDVDGNLLIDFASGIGVNNVGHCNEAIIHAVQDQASKFMHVAFNVSPYGSYIDLCKRLNAITPGDFAKKTFLANSGAEAVENAIKLARAFTKKQAVVCFDHAFHGRTYMAMTLTSKAKPYKMGFGPFNPEVYRTPFPYAYRWPGANTGGVVTAAEQAQVDAQCFAEFKDLVINRITPYDCAAVIVEPVLGEGGFIPMSRGFAAMLREFCTTHNIVLIADEIQSGFGRTGALFACEQLGLVPDMMTTAKGLGGGMPVSAVTGRADIMDSAGEGGIGGTFGGSPVSCAAALAVCEMFEKTDILARSRALGARIHETLLGWHGKYQCVGNVRGLGTMMGFELVQDRTTKEPWADGAKKLTKYCYENGLIIMTAGTYGNVVRLLMPLVIKDDELNEGFDILERGLKSLHA
jgi:4-aminobutyrate aminotransferase/(S)-3-amino-2-methylpropionate transaminase